MLNTVCITGGCGFVGANIVRTLYRAHPGVRIKVLDNLSLGNKGDIEGFGAELIEGDIRDRQAVDAAMEGADTVIHLAAHTRVMDSIEDPQLNFEINAGGTLNLLEAARHRGVGRFVFASTGGAIIGDAEPPVHEEMVPRPISPYGASKLTGEAYCSAYAGAYGLTCVALRFANVYGPFSYHKGSVVAKFYKNIINELPLTVYGDGSQTRDFVFTEDLCAAIERAATVPAEGFAAYHIGSGIETSVNKLIGEIKKATGLADYPVQYEPPRQGEVYRNYTLIDRAREELGYRPAVSLPEGLAQTWQWFQERREELTG